jgi:hypothetical protein
MHDIRFLHGIGYLVQVPVEKVFDIRIYTWVQDLVDRISEHGCVSGRQLSAFTSSLLKQALLHLTHERLSGYLEQPTLDFVRVIDHVPVLALHPAETLGEGHLCHEARVESSLGQVIQYGQVILAALFIFLLVPTAVGIHQPRALRMEQL